MEQKISKLEVKIIKLEEELKQVYNRLWKLERSPYVMLGQLLEQYDKRISEVQENVKRLNTY